MAGTQRVRAILLDDADRLVTVRREKPGADPYYVFPGGGVEETDASLEEALARELKEELGVIAAVGQVIFRHAQGSGQETREESFLLCRCSSVGHSFLGQEALGPERGSYSLEMTALDRASLLSLNLKPDVVRNFLAEHVAEVLAKSKGIASTAQ